MKETKQIILITGASSGIGRELAFRLAKDDNMIFAGVRNKTDKTEIESLNKNIRGVYIDVANQTSIDKAFWYIINRCDKLNILINNAGIAAAGPMEFIDTKTLREQFEVNTFGAFAVAKKFLPFLNNGKIINISSMAAAGLFPFLAPYCASKRAMDILFNSFLLENKNNIKVTSVKLASVKTPIWNKSVKKTRAYLSCVSEISKEKYSKELKFLEQNALNNNKNAMELYRAVDKIMEIIYKKNPKASYNIGSKAVIAEFLSKLPVDFTNQFIKARLTKINS